MIFILAKSSSAVDLLITLFDAQKMYLVLSTRDIECVQMFLLLQVSMFASVSESSRAQEE